MVPVVFVSCLYRNIVTTVIMRLDGDLSKIHNVIIFLYSVSVGIFSMYEDVMVAVEPAFNGMARITAPLLRFLVRPIATSFVGFFNGHTERALPSFPPRLILLHIFVASDYTYIMFIYQLFSIQVSLCHQLTSSCHARLFYFIHFWTKFICFII